MKIEVRMIIDLGDEVYDSRGDVDRILTPTIINTLSQEDGPEDDAGTGGWDALKLTWDVWSE